MRLTLLALAALVLAGCAHPPAQEAAPPPAPVRVHYGIPVLVSLSAQDAVVCPPMVVCGGTRGTADLVELKANQTATAFHFDVTLQGIVTTPPRPVHVEVRCSGAKACAQPLAQGDGVGPFHFDGKADLPPLSILALTARMPDATPDPLGFMAPFVYVHGSVEVDAAPGPAPRIERIPVAFDGVAGVCGFVVEPGCYSFPGGMYLNVPTNGTVHHIHVTATWTPTTSASDTMVLEAYCYPCPTMSATGASPLLADLSPTNVPDGATLQLEMGWTTPEGLPARQPFHLEGWIEVVVDAGTDQA